MEHAFYDSLISCITPPSFSAVFFQRPISDIFYVTLSKRIDVPFIKSFDHHFTISLKSRPALMQKKSVSRTDFMYNSIWKEETIWVWKIWVRKVNLSFLIKALFCFFGQKFVNLDFLIIFLIFLLLRKISNLENYF